MVVGTAALTAADATMSQLVYRKGRGSWAAGSKAGADCCGSRSFSIYESGFRTLVVRSTTHAELLKVSENKFIQK